MKMKGEKSKLHALLLCVCVCVCVCVHARAHLCMHACACACKKMNTGQFIRRGMIKNWAKLK